MTKTKLQKIIEAYYTGDRGDVMAFPLSKNDREEAVRTLRDIATLLELAVPKE